VAGFWPTSGGLVTPLWRARVRRARDRRARVPAGLWPAGLCPTLGTTVVVAVATSHLLPCNKNPIMSLFCSTLLATRHFRISAHCLLAWHCVVSSAKTLVPSFSVHHIKFALCNRFMIKWNDFHGTFSEYVLCRSPLEYAFKFAWSLATIILQ